MTDSGSVNLYTAVQDFRRARRRASLDQIMARLTGKSVDLLSYEDVREKLKAVGRGAQQLTEISLDAIVGSVGRYTDFTRRFLPKQDSDKGKWTRVMQGVTGMKGLPPIEVYQVGEAYFVLDGNHRVSVARQLGATDIEAYVTKVHTRVPLSPDVHPDDLILKAEYVDFLASTQLDILRPEVDLSVTIPGQYRVLKEHVAVHRYFMGLEQSREIPYEEAVVHWYDQVYLPVVQVIRAQGVLHEFPYRTEADLYVWVSQHRAELRQELDWDIEPTVVAADLASPPGRVIDKILHAVTPDELESGAAPGQWRTEYLAARQDDLLFGTILVPISGKEIGWQALEQALVVARREGSQVYGLHVVPTEAQKENEAAQALQAEFNRRCDAAGIVGNLVLTVGRVPRQIYQRARWTDLVVVNLAYPPPPQPLAKLGSGFRTMLRNCPRPVLAVPGMASPLSRALLAYDGSPKANEALFVSTCLASRWQIPLAVVTVTESSRTTPETLTQAQAYLERHGVRAVYVQEVGSVAEVILGTAEEQQSDIILMGGYGHSPVVEVVLGSVVDQVLCESRRPMLICR